MNGAHAQIIALARSGATGRAWDRFVTSGLDKVADKPAALTLKGRLLKDQGRNVLGEARAQLYLQSAKAYADAAALRADSYPLINAATMSLFAGEVEHAELLARQVLALLETGDGVGETPYWHEATKAEALLLLGRTPEAEKALAEGLANAPEAWEDHATTLRQFRAILHHRKEGLDWLAPYAPPKSIYFRGIMGIALDDRSAVDAVAAQLAQSGARFAYGALAAGGDILVAEAMLRLGGEVHIVLPIMPSAFKARSVTPYGDEWALRFDALLDQAASVEIIEHGDRLSLAGIQLAAEVAKGRAVDNAVRLESEAVPFEVAASDAPLLPDKSAHVVPVARSAGADVEQTLEQRQTCWWIATDANNRVAGFDPTALGQIAVRSLAETNELGQILAQLRGANPDAATAIDIAVTDDGMPDEGEAARLERLLRTATAGTTLATASAAMAIKALHVDAWIEPLGELPDLNGALSVYALGRFDEAIPKD